MHSPLHAGLAGGGFFQFIRRALFSPSGEHFSVHQESTFQFIRRALRFHIDAVMPPSTWRTVPLMKDASLLNRNAMALELSSSCPSRRSGIVRARLSYSARSLS